MRLVLKLSAIVLMAVLVQCGLVRYIDRIDEAAFVCRVLVTRAETGSRDEQELMEYASRLTDRRYQRAGLVPPAREVPEKTELASVDAW